MGWMNNLSERLASQMIIGPTLINCWSTFVSKKNARKAYKQK